MLRKLVVAAGVVSLIVAFSSGGESATPRPLKPDIPTVRIQGGMYPSFHHYMRADDGDEVLVLTTLDQAHYNRVSDPTPLLVVKGAERGVSDVTSTYFANPPRFFGARNVVVYEDPASGQPVLWICSQGREVGDHRNAPEPRVNGVWGEQDRLFSMQDGKFVDRSFRLPQSNDFSHGCAVARSGDGDRLTLVKNTLGTLDGRSIQSLLHDDGSAPANIPGDAAAPGTYWVGTADLDGNGSEDIIFGRTVVSQAGDAWVVSQQLAAPDLEAQGYSVYHGGVVGDVDNDGFPDVVMVLSGDGVRQPFLVGAKLALFINDGQGRLVYSPSALPAHTPTEFGLELRLVDLDLDGFPDIVTSGVKYSYGDAAGQYATSAIFVNNGDGTFGKQRIADPALSGQCPVHDCQVGLYVLKRKDGRSFDIVSFYNSNGISTLYGRRVTPAAPLGLQPIGTVAYRSAP